MCTFVHKFLHMRVCVSVTSEAGMWRSGDNMQGRVSDAIVWVLEIQLRLSGLAEVP